MCRPPRILAKVVGTFHVPSTFSRWAIAPVFELIDIRREPGLSPFATQFVSLEDSYRCA